MSKILIDGDTEFSKEKLTLHLINLVKGRLSVLKNEIQEIKDDLQFFQRKYSMTNEQFLELFNLGKLGDDQDYFVWKGSFDVLEKLKEEEAMLREVL